jgi:DEAD/DEAH box helicase/Helicase C-terminal domain
VVIKRTFKTGGAKPKPASDPEALFQDLKARDASIQHLWAHQADLLREYQEKHQDTADVALELPTGAGKTLVGLLIGENRRRGGERVVYLCPTRQLVHQVGEQAVRYGIDARVVLPSKYEHLTEYQMGSAIAITTYSALFNTNPRFRDANVILLDDAHAGEDYIANLWSVTISRADQSSAYHALVALFRGVLDPWFRRSLHVDSPSPDVRSKVEMLPLPKVLPMLPALIDVLEQKLEYGDQFSWRMIREALPACNIFVSWGEILIRPLSPPTMLHAPFADAAQRIYMSATLGAGGELERITGVRKIERLPIPRGWERHSSGRRLFILPNRSMKDADIATLRAKVITQAGRGLVLTPHQGIATGVGEALKKAGIAVLTSSDIEHNTDAFTQKSNAALVLTNRYDGIDLPGDTCRLLIMEGLPAGVNLQEQFLLTRLGASSLLRDRLRTRFTQGVGRCSRGPKDYAAILVLGSRLFEFCAKSENRAGMHPELQAELEFGLDNSEDLSAAAVRDLLDTFYAQKQDWLDAEEDIRQRREGKKRVPDAVAVKLAAIVAAEVDYVYALWRRDYAAALQRATTVSDGLAGAEFEGYRAFWYYMGGIAAWLLAEQAGDASQKGRAKELFERASKASKSIPWFAELAALATVAPAADDVAEGLVGEAVYSQLADLGFVGARFEERMNAFEQGLASPEATPFETALSDLGRFLGWNAYKPAGSAKPDSVWVMSDRLALPVEAKSDEKPGNSVSVRTVRQALTHATTVKADGIIASDGQITTIVLSPRTSVDPDAAALAGDLRYLHIDRLRALAGRVVAVLRALRAKLGVGAEMSTAVAEIHAEYRANGLMPRDVEKYLTSVPLKSLPKK